MAAADVLLAILARGPSHGYDLKKAYDSWFDQAKPLAFGQVYATLARFERDGLVAVADTQAGGGPERTVYEITDTGRTRVEAWLSEPVEPLPPGSDEIIRKTVVAFRLDAGPDAFLARQRAAHLRHMHALEQQAAAHHQQDEVSQLVLDHALAHLDADLRWLELAAARLRSTV